MASALPASWIRGHRSPRALARLCPCDLGSEYWTGQSKSRKQRRRQEKAPHLITILPVASTSEQGSTELETADTETSTGTGISLVPTGTVLVLVEGWWWCYLVRYL